MIPNFSGFNAMIGLFRSLDIRYYSLGNIGENAASTVDNDWYFLNKFDSE